MVVVQLAKANRITMPRPCSSTVMYASALVAFIGIILLQIVEINPSAEIGIIEDGAKGEPIVVTSAPTTPPEVAADLTGRSSLPKEEELQASKVDEIKEESSAPVKEGTEFVYSPLLPDASSGAVIHDMLVRSLTRALTNI